MKIAKSQFHFQHGLSLWISGHLNCLLEIGLERLNKDERYIKGLRVSDTVYRHHSHSMAEFLSFLHFRPLLDFRSLPDFHPLLACTSYPSS
jgi:hypothetical protein